MFSIQTRYPVIGHPPEIDGACHSRVIWSQACDFALNCCGSEGLTTEQKPTTFENEPCPIELIAATQNL